LVVLSHQRLPRREFPNAVDDSTFGPHREKSDFNPQFEKSYFKVGKICLEARFCELGST